MSKEKQIEEMAKVLCEDCARDTSPCVLTKTARMCESVKEQAEALYNAGYRKQEWISVDERLPEEDVRVLVYINSERSYTKIDTDRMVDGEWVRWSKDITHWMPLPEAPKMKGGAEE